MSAHVVYEFQRDVMTSYSDDPELERFEQQSCRRIYAPEADAIFQPRNRIEALQYRTIQLDQIRYIYQRFAASVSEFFLNI